MAKKLYSLSIRGKRHDWDFPVYVDPRYVEQWREDGIEIHEVHNVVPKWIADCGLARPWCFLQDCFHLRNPFAK